MIPVERPCTKCKQVKPLEDFSKAPKGKYGRKASCKACDAARWQDNWVSRALPTKEVQRRYDERRGTQKKCAKCGEVKDRSDFATARQGKYGPVLRECRSCWSARAREWASRSKDGDVTNARRLSLWAAYRITPSEYDALLSSQGGSCAICGSTKKKMRKGVELEFPVDHCHVTGRIRGILCDGCNRAMGLLGDDGHRIQKAIDYLRDSDT